MFLCPPIVWCRKPDTLDSRKNHYQMIARSKVVRIHGSREPAGIT
ncbi:hypothetical protein OOU_Y34scaffold01094g2 [Pyricularia oryzae Y34]|uniref:Uncharacterized protein n=1 Tax=Pyricularia oryzae (strain Y34) TaxID=1143189 RepID=A0AA97PFC5_PYRO3|nr:hypothetical protein OOU_Y34scaffold01094g2 [Pyricularia oryzae Y34]